jgi:ABC-type multidrug transport system fused ATPase/permease subunit
VESCDKLLVLSEGRVAQFGPPQSLLADKHGEFYRMTKDV